MTAKRILLIVSTLVIALTAIMTGVLVSNTGLRLALTIAEKLTGSPLVVEALQGNLLGPISVGTLQTRHDGTQVNARNLVLTWDLSSLLRGKLKIEQFSAAEIDVTTRPSTIPTSLPEDLQLPLSVEIGSLNIDRLRINTNEIKHLSLTLQSDGQHHRLNHFSAIFPFGDVSAEAKLDGAKPFALQGQLNLIASEPHQARIDASVTGTLAALQLSLTGNGEKFHGTGHAQLTPFASLPLESLKLSVTGLNPQSFVAQAPHARIKIDTHLTQQSDHTLTGSLTAINETPQTLDQHGLPLRTLTTQLNLSPQQLAFHRLDVDLLGQGKLTGQLAWLLDNPTLPGTASLVLSHIDLAALHADLRPTQLDGNLHIEGGIDRQGGTLHLHDRALSFNTEFSKEGERIDLPHVLLRHGQAKFEGQGFLQLSAEQAFHFTGKLDHFDLSAFSKLPRTILNAELQTEGTLQPLPAGKLQFTLNNSRLAQHAAEGTGQLTFAGPSHINGRINIRVGDNHLDAHGGIGDPTDHLILQLNAPALSQLGKGFQGSARIQTDLTGLPHHPSGTFEAALNDLKLPGGQALKTLHAQGKIGKAPQAPFENTIELTGLQRNAHSAPFVQKFSLRTHGTNTQHDLEAETHFNERETIQLKASGSLSSDTSDWSWRGTLKALQASGSLPLSLKQAVPISASAHSVDIGKADIAVADGTLHIERVAWTPRAWQSSGTLSGIALRFMKNNTPGTSTLKLGGSWHLHAQEKIEGKLHIERESGDWILSTNPPLSLGLQTLRLDASVENNQFHATLDARGTRLGTWSTNLNLPFLQSEHRWQLAKHAPISGHVHASAPDLAWLGPIIHPNLRSGGRFFADAKLAGSIDAPRLVGQVRGENLKIALLDQGIRLEQGKLAARFDDQILRIDTLRFAAPSTLSPPDKRLPPVSDGSIEAHGTIDLGQKSGQVSLSALRAPLVQRSDLWMVTSGNTHVNLEKNQLRVTGRITADSGYVAYTGFDHPQLSDDVIVLGREPQRQGPLKIAMDLALDLGTHFFVHAEGLDTRLSGSVAFRTQPGEPLRAVGTVMTHEGELQAYGQRLTISRGIVNFQGPVDDPGLNIRAIRSDLPIEAGVEVTGSAQAPQIRLVSTPNVPDSEKLSWIVLGRPPDPGGTDATLLLAAAGSIFGSKSGGITTELAHTLGVDEISLRQADGAAPSLSNQIVAIGKRLSARTRLSYEQGLTAATGVMKLTHNLTPRVSFITRTGSDNAIDIFYSFSFD